MSASLTLQQLLEVQEFFGLPSAALVEKDYYVTRALTAISAIDVTPLMLVFGGGTALCRAHRLIRRMSEDIDCSAERYETFQRDMVYGEPIDYAHCLETLSELFELVKTFG